LVFNAKTNLTQTETIRIDLNGLDDDTTLADLATALDAVDGLSATVTTTGRLALASDSPESQFAFAGDTSGVLAALGMNTFFSGSTASGISVSQVLVDDPAKFAASRAGIGVDSENAVDLVAFLDQPLESDNGASLSVLYNHLTADVTQGSTVARSVAEGFRAFEETLVGQRLATSGVSLDEEAVRLMTLQRTYQASARYIATLAELLDILVNL
jgi:flagellar hook-associated protein 1 FlgK